MKINIYIVIVFISLISFSNSAKDNCYVLALEGGGDKGSYQAGAIKGLVDNLAKEDVEWDIITGISVGSVNTFGLSFYPTGEEKAAANDLVELWKKIKGPRDIYKNWPWGEIGGLLYKSGIFDNSPLKDYLENARNNRTVKRKFVIGATNFETGIYETWNETSLPPEEISDAVIASSSIWGFFPLKQFKNSTYFDGGTKLDVDIPSGVNRCKEMGFNDEKIVVDIIYCYEHNLPKINSKNIHPLGSFLRFMGILWHDNAIKDLNLIKQIYPFVRFRYIVRPTQLLPSGNFPIQFDPKEIETMINYGIQDSVNIIKKGWANNLDFILEEQTDKKYFRFLN